MWGAYPSPHIGEIRHCAREVVGVKHGVVVARGGFRCQLHVKLKHSRIGITVLLVNKNSHSLAIRPGDVVHIGSVPHVVHNLDGSVACGVSESVVGWLSESLQDSATAICCRVSVWAFD